MFKYPCRSAVSDITQFLGRLVHNSQCHYKLDNCSQRKCLVRSPHYPGMYPRNLTCSYHVFVLPSKIPAGKPVIANKESLNHSKHSIPSLHGSGLGSEQCNFGNSLLFETMILGWFSLYHINLISKT